MFKKPLKKKILNFLTCLNLLKFKQKMIFQSLLLILFICISLEKKFQFNENHTFTILQITDLHYGESEDTDAGNMKNQRFFIENIKPDLVIVTGDMVSGYSWDGIDQNFYQNLWFKFSQIFNDTKTYYAYALGNHDHQANYNREQIVKLDATNPWSLMNAKEELDWASTYHIPVFSSYNDSDLAANLWIFDSGDQYLYNISWGKITDDQISWYHETSKELKEKYKKIPHGLAFFHIPIPEFIDVWNNNAVYGDKNEKVCCPLFNHGTVINAFLKEGDVSGVFCGHDHNNDYGGWLKGIELVYGRKSGYGGYGPPKDVTRGARVIVLTENYDEILEESFVNRENFIFDENGHIILNGEASVRDYQYQLFCSPSIF